MKLCIIGSGYVGLVAGTCFAETGNDVTCVDVDKSKIALLQKGQVPIYEPGLAEMILRNVAEERLKFSTDLTAGVQGALVILIAVGTPSSEDGSSDLSHVVEAARSVACSMNGYKIIVTKSTVPVGTTDRLYREILALTRFQFDVVSNPEFLKEGTAIEDFMKPDRVVIGTEGRRAAEIMKELYAPFTRTGAPILVMDTCSAEMTKYAANAMLASRISFMNEIANLCEHVGADVHWVRQGIGLDHRIGPSFLFPGIGYGGSCFPKDIRALISVAREHNYPLQLVPAIEEVNNLQRYVAINKILKFYSSEVPSQLEKLREGERTQFPDSGLVLNRSRQTGSQERDYNYVRSLDMNKVDMAFESVKGGEGHSLAPPDLDEAKYNDRIKDRTFAVWGLSFKPRTDDMREAPARVIIRRLLELGAQINAYDPQALEEARKMFGESIRYARNNYEALQDADALILLTEWNVFRNPDFQKVKKLLRYPVIFDGRNQYNPQEMKERGFIYFGIGRRC